jgi:HPt (histidine-containing phosphotransfer) domain-containing protein
MRLNFYKTTKTETNAHMVDLSYLKVLSDGDDSFVGEMIALFQQLSPAYLKKVSMSIFNRDITGLSQIVHKMRSTVSYFGAVELAKLLAEIENFIVIDKRYDDAFRKACFIEPMTNRLLNELASYAKKKE